MTADKELIKQVAQELWDTTKKLRPGLPKIVRSQLVLKALMTIGDLPRPAAGRHDSWNHRRPGTG